MQLSRFNNKGIREFQNLLETARQGIPVDTPLAILTAPEYTENI